MMIAMVRKVIKRLDKNIEEIKVYEANNKKNKKNAKLNFKKNAAKTKDTLSDNVFSKKFEVNYENSMKEIIFKKMRYHHILNFCLLSRCFNKSIIG